MTFLLAGPPYDYSPLTIGLFGLIGIAAMLFGPLYARTVTDRFVPHLSVLVGLSCCAIAIALGTFIGKVHISGPVLQAFLLDFGMQTAQIANRTAIYSIEPKRRNGVNTAFMVFTFCGQLVGTAVGNHVYARGGWIASGSASLGFIGAAIGVMCVRGPWEEGWLGWSKGWSFRKRGEQGTVNGRGKVESGSGKLVELKQGDGDGDEEDEEEKIVDIL